MAKNGKYPKLDICVDLRWQQNKRPAFSRKHLYYSSLARALPAIAKFSATHPECTGGTVGNRKGTRTYAMFTNKRTVGKLKKRLIYISFVLLTGCSSQPQLKYGLGAPVPGMGHFDWRSALLEPQGGRATLPECPAGDTFASAVACEVRP